MNETILIVQSKHHSQVFKTLKLINTDSKDISTFQKGIFITSDHYTDLRYLLTWKRVWLKGAKSRKLVRGADQLFQYFIKDQQNILVYTNIRKWLFKGLLKGDISHIVNLVNQPTSSKQASIKGYLNKLTFKRYLP